MQPRFTNIPVHRLLKITGSDGGKPVQKSRMNGPSGQTSFLARLATDDATARRLADALAEAFDAGETAVAAYGDDAGGWTVEIYFGRAPDQDAVRALLADLAGEEAGGGLALDTHWGRLCGGV